MGNVEDTTGLCRLIMLRKSWDIFSFSLKLLAFLIHSSKTLTTQIVVFCGNLLWITEGQDWHLLQLLTRGLLGAFKGWGQKWAFFVSPTALVLETWNLAKSFLAVGMFENCWPWHQAPQVLLMLTYLFISAKLNGTGQRWVNELSYFNFSIHYKRGSENVVKDSLSRYPLLHECNLQ